MRRSEQAGDEQRLVPANRLGLIRIGLAGFSVQLTQWRGLGFVLQTVGAVLATAGVLLLAFGKD